MKKYSFTDEEFKEKVRRTLDRGGIIDGKAIYRGRSFTAAIEEFYSDDDIGSENFAIYLLSNDISFIGARGSKNRRKFKNSYAVRLGDEDWGFLCDFIDIPDLSPNPKYIVILDGGQAGSFDSKESMSEFLEKNPYTKCRFFELANELKPEIKIEFD